VGIGSLVTCVLLGLLANSGCSGPKDRYARVPISGTVKLDGQPLMKGYIIFEPKGDQPTQTAGMIQDGKFDVPRASGPVPGKYLVSVYSGAEDATGGAEPGAPERVSGKKTRGERVPKKFNIQTTLVREVQADGENVFDFDLPSK
jgi:hypothetical protein